MSDEHVYTQQFDIPVAEAPQRVVSLVPSMTESFFDLGLGRYLVGRTDYCIYPEGVAEGLPSVGGTQNPDIQQILALQPDLVILSAEENRQEDAEALQAANVPVWTTYPKSVADVFNLLWNVMYLFDVTDMVPRVRLIEQTYDWVWGITQANEDHPVTVFVPIWQDPLMTFNRETYMHDLLRVCGGTNVFADRQRRFPLAADLGEAAPYPDDDPRVVGRDRRYPRLTLDELVAAQPDVILLPSEPYPFGVEHLPLFQALDVPAAHHQRIHLVDGANLTWPGTRVAYALDSLPSLFYPPE